MLQLETAKRVGRLVRMFADKREEITGSCLQVILPPSSVSRKPLVPLFVIQPNPILLESIDSQNLQSHRCLSQNQGRSGKGPRSR